MALNLGKAVVDYLTAHPEEKFSARQIAEWVFATFPDECNAKKASSQALETDADLLQQLVAEIGSQRPRLQKKYPNLKTTEGRPRKYYFSEKSDSAEVAAVENMGASAPVGKDEANISIISTIRDRRARNADGRAFSSSSTRWSSVSVVHFTI